MGAASLALTAIFFAIALSQSLSFAEETRSGLLEEVLRDDHALYLAGPLVDAEDACVTIRALHRRVPHVAHSAVDLQDAVGDAVRELGGVDLDHGRLSGNPHAA